MPPTSTTPRSTTHSSTTHSSAGRALVIDLDGTLADSAGDIAGALNQALAAAGHRTLPTADVVAMIGHGARTLTRRALTALGAPAAPADIDAMLAAFIAAYAATPCRETRLYPHTRSTLDRLTADGWRFALCTNKPQTIAEQVVATLGLVDDLVAVIGGRDGVPLKPAGDMVDLALAALGDVREAVMVGDSGSDVGAARAAGIPVVLVSHGYSAVPVGTLGADVVIDGLAELPTALARLTVAAR